MRDNLFELPDRFQNRVDELKDSGLKASSALLLLQVELGFALMECLQLQDEPITAVWSVLSGMPLRCHRLQNLTMGQRRAIANARQLIPYSARFAWISALEAYIQEIDISLRNYGLTKNCLDKLDSIIIDACKVPDDERHQANDVVYEHCLDCQLSYNLRDYSTVQANVSYRFEAQTETETVPASVSFSTEQLALKATGPDRWFDAQCDKSPFAFTIQDLMGDAIYLDEQEERLSERFGWKAQDRGNWVSRLHKISFRKTQADGTLGEQNTELITLDGFIHLAGMVAAGKTTLSTLLAVHILRHWPNRRLTIVVGDTQSAIRLVNQINWWFCDDPEAPEPVAIPLLGRSRRDNHLRAFHVSKDYRTHLEREQPHWGERWLGTVCPLQAVLDNDVSERSLGGRSLVPGTEPCYALRGPTPEDQQGQQSRKSLCPYFTKCPSQQTYRDMPLARVWITTAGGMAMGGLPRHLEKRRIKVGELVYEQSSIVIFDEIDTIIKWFDDVYAETVMLTNGKDGVFDTINIQSERYITARRVRPPLTQKWTATQRNAQTVITATLTLLNDSQGRETLNKWIRRGSFTPNTLFYKLARRIAGLEEVSRKKLSAEQQQANSESVQEIMGLFNKLLNLRNPLRARLSAEPLSEPLDGLTRLLQSINTTGESATSHDIHRSCRGWINRFFPKTEKRLQALRTEIEGRLVEQGAKAKTTEEKVDEIDTVETLAYRLQFALTITLLDIHTRSVFYQWQHRPEEMTDESPHRRMPASMLNILPLPLTGRQFGTYYSRQSEGNRGGSSPLSMFAYTNIGRQYILNFHRLLTDLNGQRGPNVLALSGTSYLPDSTQFHVGTQTEKPYGVLMPEATARDAIADSHFEFLPQFDEDEQPIRFSGRRESEKPEALRAMVRSLVGNGGRGHLGQQLRSLNQMSQDVCWTDRDRILLLVNSYKQSLWAANAIRHSWPNQADLVYHLVPSRGRDQEDIPSFNKHSGALLRDDIESFGQTNGKILVAPTDAIGRGFNILNNYGKAAFGAIYLLTRPYPHPYDTQQVAQELNRRSLDWLEDPEFIAWQEDGVQGKAEAARHQATRYWTLAEQRTYYSTLRPNETLRAKPRKDLAATTAGVLIQAVGRLIRGGVPFCAYFVDSAWAPTYARDRSPETPETSLLAAVIDLLEDYVYDDLICEALYGPLADAITAIENFERQPIHRC